MTQNSSRQTLEQFIEKANIIHINKYDYSKVNYINSKTKVIIVCKIHKEFSQVPAAHLQGIGCPECAGNKKMTNQEFINRANIKHSNKYDYSKTVYKGTENNVIIICQQHGEFKQTPHMHLYGNGCPTCGRQKANKSMAMSQEEFIIRAKKLFDNYDYSQTKYINANTKIIVKCPIHNDFIISPFSHLSGRGCWECGKISCVKKRTYTNEYIDNFLVTNNIPVKRIDDYINSKVLIKWKCLLCENIFNKKFNCIYNGNYCIQCSKCRKNEKLVGSIIKYNNIKIKKIIIRDNDKRYYPDFYLPDFNLIIEYQGAQHYKPVRFGNMSHQEAENAFVKQLKRDEFVREYCNYNNINLLEINGIKYEGKKLKIFVEDFIMKLIK